LSEPLSPLTFRGNIVLDLNEPFVEDDDVTFEFENGASFQTHLTCERCEVINVRPEDGTRRTDVLKALIEMNRTQNRTETGFGRKSLLKDGSVLALNEKVEVRSKVKTSSAN
jgi:uncharacterized protein YcbX